MSLHALLLWPRPEALAPLPLVGSLQARLVPPSAVAAPAAPSTPPAPPTPAARRARAPASAPAGEPLPLQFPPAGEMAYPLRWQGDEGEALLRFEIDGERYRMTLARGTAKRQLPAWISEGRLTAAGLQPERFQAGRRAWPLPPGVQDRLSWIWQAAALARAQALRPGQALQLRVHNWRGETADWVLRAEADAERPGWLRLRRELPDAARLEQLLWLDPARQHRPVALRVRFDAQERWELGPRDISPTPPQGE